MSAIRKIASYLKDRVTPYPVAEVCAITGLSVSQVNNMIDEIAPLGVAEAGNGTRSVEARGLFAIALGHDMASWNLKPEQRVSVISEALQSKKVSIDVPNTALSVRVDIYRKKIALGLKTLFEAEEAVTSIPAVMHGEPCIRGTRVPVYMIAGLVKSSGREEAARTYGSLTEKQINLACVYATARPRRGRPKSLKDRLPSHKAKKSKSVVVD
jgi:uncharacterized protein (DUF433 family)